MKKIAAVLLTLTALFALLTGCKGPYSDQDAVDILIPLLEKDAELNLYIWGDGFFTRDDPGQDVYATDTCKYYRVNEDAPYHSVAELKTAISQVYSTQMQEKIYQYAFENTAESMARFCDFKQNDAIADLQIDVTANHPPRSLTAVFYPATAVVERSTATIIEAKVEYSIGEDGERQTTTVRLLKQDDVWKLDTYTWAGEVA
ncbi:MAG: hypothetical protein IJX76_09225 [Clostridia bacterium]|nr:hypothetical protein [Clostridia bacterium]